MRYLSVCSGIESASAAWEGFGWEPVAFAEIDPFASAVLTHHFPHVPNLGDFTKIGKNDVGAVDLLVGGTPCQDFSVAGLRAGLDGERGRLTIEFVRLLERIRPRWVVWENVPGILSADDGRAFGIFLGALGKLGYGFAYRVLDAQYFGVPQRRRRVFVVGYLGDWRPAAAVLFERESLSGHSPESRKAGTITSALTANGVGAGGGPDDNAAQGNHLIAATLTRNAYCDREGQEENLVIAHTLRAEGFDASEDGTGRGVPLVPAFFQDSEYGAKEYNTAGTLRAGRPPHHQILAFSCKDHGEDASDIAPTLRAMGFSGSHANAGGQVAVAFALRVREDGAVPEIHEDGETIGALRAASGGSSRDMIYGISSDAIDRSGEGDGTPGQRAGLGIVADASPSLRARHPSAIGGVAGVRRLLPVECERLMGFPDSWTAVPYRGKPASDGPRYRALGNSMAVPVMRWIGQRIALVEQVLSKISQDISAA